MKIAVNQNQPLTPPRLPASKPEPDPSPAGDKVELSARERIALARATDPVLNGMRAGFLGAGAGALAGPMAQGLGAVVDSRGWLYGWLCRAGSRLERGYGGRVGL